MYYSTPAFDPTGYYYSIKSSRDQMLRFEKTIPSDTKTSSSSSTGITQKSFKYYYSIKSSRDQILRFERTIPSDKKTCSSSSTGITPVSVYSS